ncbi:hypothetical protein F66182_2012 [Fusarium sp. NRRL 66182]|nr:hypothetical protein F66182_2012 [Fusarium sp. NRRL 66182]
MASNEHIDLNEENGSSLIATSASLLALSWFSVGLRTYTRVFLMECQQLDDWLMLIAQIIFTLSCAFILQGVQTGLGKHNDAVVPDEVKVRALMWQALATATYVLDMMFIKLSIGIFLLRISVKSLYTWIIRVSLVIVGIWSIVLFFWNLFQCNPVEMQWDFRITDGHCVSSDQIIAAAYAISAMTVLSDWLYALLPIPMLWSVKMTKQAKVTVIIILGLGIFASLATLVRLRFLADLTDTHDILFAGTNAMVWTLIEPGVAIVASSLATIRPLLRAMKIKGFESTENTYGTGYSAAARSHVKRSKSGVRIMPGFGLNDVPLTNVEPKSDTNTLPYPNDIDNLCSQRLSDDPLSPSQESTVKSETLVIQSNKSAPLSPYRSHTDYSASNSYDQIHDLEAQSQDLGRHSIGRGPKGTGL